MGRHLLQFTQKSVAQHLRASSTGSFSRPGSLHKSPCNLLTDQFKQSMARLENEGTGQKPRDRSGSFNRSERRQQGEASV